MDQKLHQTIDKLAEAIDDWLSPGNYSLKEAIDQTVNEGYFSFEDIKFQLRTLKKTLKAGEFHRWAERARVDTWERSSENVLCLHAGNLPLVGIQDILAVVLSGKRYIGKLSRKDPFLPETLLSLLERRELLDGTWTKELSSLKDSKADAVMFSGAAESTVPVMNVLKELKIIENNTPALIRTAHFSIALIEDDKPDTFHQLAHAVFRYGGSGCRSVAMVVAPFDLRDKKCEFTDYVEEFWLRNPQHKNPPPSLYYRFAYNKAVDIEQSWLDHFLIEQSGQPPSEPFVLHWVKGEREDFVNLARKHQNGLQTIYTTDPDIKFPDDLPQAELLMDAQQPPIWWKPDGTDPLEWLAHHKKFNT